MDARIREERERQPPARINVYLEGTKLKIGQFDYDLEIDLNARQVELLERSDARFLSHKSGQPSHA